MVTANRLDYLLNTVWAVASSRYVKWFVIGYTAQPAHNRRRDYGKVGFDHLVILADKLTRSEAHIIEECLQDECKRGLATGEPYRRKYHPIKRLDVYRRSAGSANVIPPDERGHSVYMAWVEPES